MEALGAEGAEISPTLMLGVEAEGGNVDGRLDGSRCIDCREVGEIGPGDLVDDVRCR